MLPRAALMLGVLLSASGAFADFEFADFSDLSQMNLVSSARQLGTTLDLTGGNGGQAGNGWFQLKQSVALGFDTYFDIDMIGGSAEGMSFIIQNSGAFVGGGHIGYANISNSIAIEFDTWNNGIVHNDPSDNHVSIHTRGADPNSPDHLDSLGSTSAVPTLDNDEVHQVRVLYRLGVMSIYVDDMDSPVLEVTVDLATLLNLDEGRAWVGFGGSTGSLIHAQSHRVLNWSFHENLCDLGIASGIAGPGATELLPITLDRAPTEVDTFGFQVHFDPAVLQFNGSTVGDLISGWAFTQIVEVGPGILQANGTTFNANQIIPVETSGVLFTLNFEVLQAVDEGTTTLICFESLSDDVADWVDCCGEIFLGCCRDGDVTNDDAITPGDALAIFQHFLQVELLDECTRYHGDVAEPMADPQLTPGDALCVFQFFLNQPSCMSAFPLDCTGQDEPLDAFQ